MGVDKILLQHLDVSLSLEQAQPFGWLQSSFYLTYLLLSMAGVVTFVQLVRYMVSLVLKA